MSEGGLGGGAAGRPPLWPGTLSPGGLPCRELCARGWNFLSLLTGFFLPSTTLMPYVTKFLQDSSQSQGAYGRVGASRLGSRSLGRGWEALVTPSWLLPAELARSSQEHLQRTVKYGGRRRLPSPGEMQAFLVLGVRVAGCSGTPLGGEAGLLSTDGLTLPHALAERANGPPVSNSPARGRGL